MAVLRPTLGPITQSFGNLTTAKWKDKTVLKQKVPANNTSQSAAQISQRRKFALIAQLAAQLAPALRVGYKTSATSMTEQNVFQKKNAQYVSIDADLIVSMDYTKMEVSAGNVETINITAPSANASSHTINASWPDNSNGGSALPTDKVTLVAVNTVNDTAIVAVNVATRADKKGSVTVPGLTEAAALNYRVYAFAKRDMTTATSPTTSAMVAI